MNDAIRIEVSSNGVANAASLPDKALVFIWLLLTRTEDCRRELARVTDNTERRTIERLLLMVHALGPDGVRAQAVTIHAEAVRRRLPLPGCSCHERWVDA